MKNLIKCFYQELCKILRKEWTGDEPDPKPEPERSGGMLFKYEAMNGTGEEVTGTFEAANETEAADKVRALNYFPTKVTKVGTVLMPVQAIPMPEVAPPAQLPKHLVLESEVRLQCNFSSGGGHSIAYAVKDETSGRRFLVVIAGGGQHSCIQPI